MNPDEGILFSGGAAGAEAEFGAGIRCAVEKGWLELHESGTYVRLLTAVERAAQSIDQRE